MRFHSVRIVEEAVQLLRRQPAAVWLRYLLGAAPFALVLLWFLRDMATGYFGNRCAYEALICTLVFFWASVWKARFGAALVYSLQAGPAGDSAGFLRICYRQGIVQALKLTSTALAMISVLPFPWVSLFFRSAAAETCRPDTNIRGIFSRSAQRASAFGRSNWVSTAILCVVAVLVFLNAFILAAALPFLARMFTGNENEWTMNFQGLFSFQVVSVVLVLCWLILDPLFQAHAALRTFYADSRRNGGDLFAKLRAITLLAALLMAVPTAFAAVQGPQVKKAVEQAQLSDDYGWLRAQSNTNSNASGNWLIDKIRKAADAVSRAIAHGVNAFGKWLRRLFYRQTASDPGPPLSGSSAPVRWLLLALAMAAAGVLVALLVRFLRNKKDTAAAPMASVEARDLSSDSLIASDLPEEEWLRMARTLLDKGEARLALRAFYLSNLAFLGSAQLIRISRSKTNAVYERELRLKPGPRDAFPAFVDSNRSFERVWYGFHEATPELIANFRRAVEAIRGYAKA